MRHPRRRRDVADGRDRSPHPGRRRPHAVATAVCDALDGRLPVHGHDLTRVPSQRVSVDPGTRKLLRLEVRNAQTPIERKPPWIKTRARMGPEYTELKALVKREGLHTVCEEAGCPNIYECWEDREATFLIGGEQCTRRCDFCQIDTGKPDRPRPRRTPPGRRERAGDGSALLDGHRRRPRRPARRRRLALRRDGRASSKSSTPAPASSCSSPTSTATPTSCDRCSTRARRCCAHNLETVPRIFKRIRPAFRYQRSLDVLTAAREYGLVTKSNLILGMGETPEEVPQALVDLHEAGCDIITITQYLRPSLRHHPVERWVKPEEFVEHSAVRRAHRLRRRPGRAAGPVVVPGGPVVRAGDRASNRRRSLIRTAVSLLHGKTS